MTDRETLERIRRLVIPPGWDSVWICPWPHGHIQAVGVDAKGRRQYRYHDDWRRLRDREKFDHMVRFGTDLPRLRRKVVRALKTFDSNRDPSRDEVLASAVRLLDLGCFRIGSDSYAEENGTYGLASMETRHVRVGRNRISFDFTAKGGQRCTQDVTDPLVAAVVRRLKSRRPAKSRLLAAKEGRRWTEVDSNQINAFIKTATGGDFTAKDFRTWKATVLAGACLAKRAGGSSAQARKRSVAAAMKDVAEYLGDTPAVARSSYVDPRVVDLYMDGVTVDPTLGRDLSPVAIADSTAWSRLEAAVLDLLDERGEHSRAA